MSGRRASSGQMVVEMAVLVPVVVVCALIVVNLARFCEACARFDRVAFDAVVMQGVSPAGEIDQASGVAAVRSQVEQAMGDSDHLTVEVSASTEGEGGSELLSLVPSLVTYTCVLEYRPSPSGVSIAGVSMGSPVALRHERRLVVDRYKSGVVG